jgi:glycosyltransferase involved in cell wall biosynthesis
MGEPRDKRRMISFIVPAYNEERLLGATLDALHAAARAVGEPYELIVADDASADQTALVARRHGARLVHVAHRQIAATRNSGAREAKGELLVFVDADTIVNEAVARAAVHALRGGAVGGGAAVQFDGVIPLYARVLLPAIVRLFRAGRLAAGCFLFCTRSAFVSVGGFDETFFGAEEVIMSQALKRRGRFVILRQSVRTSGRKLRTHSAGEMLSIMFRLALRGRNAVRQREGMELWYSERREDPQRDA